MLVGKRMSQLIFPYKIIENSLTSLAHNSVFIDSNNFKFNTETRGKLGQIDRNLHDHVFDDVICKPPIDSQWQGSTQDAEM